MTKSKQSSSSTDLPPSWEWRGGRLRIRKKWPAWVLKVRPDLKGKDFTKSLGTSDLKAADRSAALALAEFHSLCDAYVTPKPPANAVEWIYSLPDGDASGASEGHFNLAQIEMAKAYASQLPTMVAALLSDDAKARIADLIRAELDATTLDDARRLRDLAYPEELPQGDAHRAEDKPLNADALLTAWNAEKKSAPSTLKKYAATFRAISKCLGFDDVRRITPDDVVKFKEARIAAGISVSTIEDDIRAAGGVSRWAVKNRKLTSNPFDDLAPTAPREGTAPRAPFTDTEARAILTKARSETGWLRWASWLLCFTGARIGEIAELRRGDVRQEGDVWILDFKPNTQRKGKNKTFQRMLPLHPALIAEGFLDYVTALPAGPDGPLFPSLTPDPQGARTNPATTQLGRWMRNAVGITDPAKAPAHSWRHRMEDQIRKARLVAEVADAITGRHNPRNSGAGYGKGFRQMPDEVLKELQKLPSPIP